MSIRQLAVLVAVSLGLWGCGNKPEYREFSDKDNVENTAPAEEHHHPEHGPNGGHVVILGHDDYHAELLFDAANRNVTVMLLDHDMTTLTPVEGVMVLKLEGAPEPIAFESAPQEFDPAGQTSRFTLAGDKLPESVKAEEDLHGKLELTVAGTPHAGEIAHDHDHEGHDHAAHDDHDHKE